jgi:MtN3 and saliva related transmembrane protein
MTELIGWSAATVLLATMVRQVWVQWKSGTAQGVTKWLFIGQLTASILFAVYSLLLANWVFVVSNVALIVVAIAGQIFHLRNRRHDALASQPGSVRSGLTYSTVSGAKDREF